MSPVSIAGDFQYKEQYNACFGFEQLVAYDLICGSSLQHSMYYKILVRFIAFS